MQINNDLEPTSTPVPVEKALIDLTNILSSRGVIPQLRSKKINCPKTRKKITVEESVSLTPIRTPVQFKQWVDNLLNPAQEFLIAYQTEHDSYIVRMSREGRLLELININKKGQHESSYVFSDDDYNDENIKPIREQLLRSCMLNVAHFQAYEGFIRR